MKKWVSRRVFFIKEEETCLVRKSVYVVSGIITKDKIEYF